MKFLKIVRLAAVAAAFLLSGCNFHQEFTPPPNSGEKAGPKINDYQAGTEAGRAYQGLLDLTVSAVASLAEKVFEYDPDLLDINSPRSARARGGLDMLGLLSLADLSKTAGGAPRAAESPGLPTLEEELSCIVSAFEQEMRAYAVDDLSFLDGVPGISVENGVVVYEDDLCIDPQTPAGIMQLQLLKANLAGEDTSAILADMSIALANYPSEQDGPRGVFLHSTPLWPNRQVVYLWGGIDAASKILFQEAMADWQSKVPGLQFVNLADYPSNISSVYMRMVLLGQSPLVFLQSDPNLTPNGLANVGALKGLSTCTIQGGLTGVTAFRTPRHELGHTLGLQHEHVRWDRDEYLQFSLEGLAYVMQQTVKAPQDWRKYDAYYTIFGSLPFWTYVQIPVNVSGVTVYVYYLVINTTSAPSVAGSVEFDYLSIMLYSTKQIPATNYDTNPPMTAKVAKQGLNVGSPIEYNTAISEGDAATVMFMYR